MREKIRTMPSTIDSSPVHQAALAKGTEHFHSLSANVADRFKGISIEDTVKKMLKKSKKFKNTTTHSIEIYCVCKKCA